MDPAFDLKPVSLVAHMKSNIGGMSQHIINFQHIPTAGHPRALGVLQAPGRRTKALAVTDSAPGRTEGTADGQGA